MLEFDMKTIEGNFFFVDKENNIILDLIKIKDGYHLFVYVYKKVSYKLDFVPKEKNQEKLIETVTEIYENFLSSYKAGEILIEDCSDQDQKIRDHLIYCDKNPEKLVWHSLEDVKKKLGIYGVNNEL